MRGEKKTGELLWLMGKRGGRRGDDSPGS